MVDAFFGGFKRGDTESKRNKENIAVKRPAGGLSPMLYFKILGKKSKRKFKVDSLLK